MSPKRHNKRRDIRRSGPDSPAEKSRNRPSGQGAPPVVKRAGIDSPVRNANAAPVKAGTVGGRQFLGVVWWQAGAVLLITLLFFLLYLKTAARSLPPGDSGELISAAWNLGVAHPPGYPTFTILSHLAGLFPVGTPAFRLNLLSVILDSLALGILGFGMLRFLRAKMGESHNSSDQLIPLAGVVIGIGLLAVSTVFWSYSLVAEVFALNNLLAAIVLVLMLEWVRQPSQRWFLWISCLLSGLALTNQLTFIMLGPGLIFLLVWGLLRRRRGIQLASVGHESKRRLSNSVSPVSELGIGAGFLILGLLPYIYLPIAAGTDPLLNWGDPSNLSNFWRVLTRANYGTFSFTAGGLQGDRWQQLVVIGRYFFDSFTLVGVLLAMLGIVWFVRRKQAEGIGLGLAFLFSGPFFAMFANPQITNPLTQGVFERFYILPGIPLAAFIMAGGAYLLELLQSLVTGFKGAVWPWAVVAIGLIAAIAVPAGIASARIPAIDMSQNQVAENYGKEILQTLEPNSLLIVMGGDENAESLLYMQTVLNYRTDVTVLNVQMMGGPWYIDQQRHRHPGITLPFPYYSVTSSPTSLLVDLVNANIGQRTVYGLETPGDQLSKNFDIVFAGLAYQFVAKSADTDSFAILAGHSDRFINLHYPDKVYPPTSWEALIASRYGTLAYYLAFALQQPGAQPNADLVERLYRNAILNATELTAAYKNLGLVLYNNKGSPDEIISLWTKYLQLVPNDPEADSLRSAMATLKAGSK